MILLGLLVACSGAEGSGSSEPDANGVEAADTAEEPEAEVGVWVPPAPPSDAVSDDGTDDREVDDTSTESDASEDADQPEVVADVPTDSTPVEPDVAPEEDLTEPEDVEPPADVEEPDTVGPEPPPLDCDNIPQGPFPLKKLDGPMASEDLAFDMEGNVVGSNDQAIFKSPYQSNPQVFVPNMKFRAGLRYLPNGHLIVCNNQKGELIRIDTDGIQHTLVVGLSYPNGLTVDLEGWIYFTEHDNNTVWRVHPFTGEQNLLTDQISNPNGLTFSPDYKTLYIGGFNGQGTVYAMSLSPSGMPGKLVPFATDVGTGWLDGMATDACGNVYIADYGQTVIFRISPDGQDKQVVIDGGDIQNAYLPNLQWGSGIGGWDPLSVYLPDGWNKGVFEVQLGVPGKQVPYP